ncbi:adenosine-specific kinase [Candidatus Bathyarchaeota archaeon]|nr:adenosine-specific kinase [Candidatus Bathyarchaeota archaeon]MBS7613110.1 adenosine-specific kinase [Candidatus Bathyarchaeota archaeon]
MELKIEVVQLAVPKDVNVIIGQAHFIKTVEDLHEALVNSVPTVKFGLAFNESSGPCLVRASGNDDELKKLAIDNALKIGCGHVFIIYLKEAYPINVLNAIKHVPEVCRIIAATANPLQVIVAETDQGRGILGVVDGFKTKGVEEEKDIEERRGFLRKIGYKL